MATVTHKIANSSTTNASTYTTASFTPVAGDLIVVFVHSSGVTIASTGTTSAGIGFSQVETALDASSANTSYMFVATSFATATAQTFTFNCTGTTATGAAWDVYCVAGMTLTGAAAVKQTATLDNHASGTPSVAFTSNALTGNPTFGSIGNATNPATMTAPTGWTEGGDVGYATPTTGLETVFRASGFTSMGITWGSSSASAFGAIIAEMDTSVPPNTPTLSTPSNGGTASSTTPTLDFSTTDPDGSAVSYEVQVDTVNTFNSNSSTFSLISSTSAAGNTNTVTTTGITTTGANLIVIGLSTNTGGVVALTDSKGNTWTPLTAKAVTSNGTSQMFYCFGPTVGTGHTFTNAGSSNFCSIFVQAWSGAQSAPFDVQNGATNAAASTLATGSITPTVNNEVVISHFMFSVAGTASVNSGLTISNQTNFGSGNNYGGAMGYIVQTTAGAINPTWTSGGGATGLAATIASFKVGASPLIDHLSSTDPGFADVTNPGDTDPFPSGDTISYTLQAGEALTNGNTYFWRVRAKDPLNTNIWSSYASPFDFTVSAGTSASVTQVAANLTATGGTQSVASVGDISIIQSAATVTATGGTQVVVSQQFQTVAQIAANITATGGTQAVTSIQDVSITQVHATLTVTGGTQSVATTAFGTITQVAATITATGGTQVVQTFGFITQSAANITATGGTQAIATIRDAAISQVAATITATGGTQVVSAGFVALISQIAATLTATGGTQAVVSKQIVAISQTHATLTATGGTQAIAAIRLVTIAQVHATLTATGGTQVPVALSQATIAQVFASIIATGGIQKVFAPPVWVPITYIVTSGSKFTTDTSGLSVANVLSGAKIEDVTSGTKTNQIQSGETEAIVTGSETKVNL